MRAFRSLLPLILASLGLLWGADRSPLVIDSTGRASPVQPGDNIRLPTSAGGFFTTIQPAAGGSYTLTGPAATTTLAGLGLAQTFLAQQQIQAAGAFIHRQAATQDGIAMQGRAGGTSSYTVTLTPTTLTASRTITAPDADIVASGSASALTSGRVPYATTGGLLLDSANLTFNGTNFAHGGGGTFATGTGAVSLNGSTTIPTGKTLTVTDLTTGRVTYSSTAGLQVNSSNLTFDGTNFAHGGGGTFATGTGAVSLNGSTTIPTGKTLTVTDLTTGRVTYSSTAGLQVNSSNLTFDGANFAHAGTGTFATGTGAVSLNGSTTIPTGKTLTVTDLTTGRVTYSSTAGLQVNSSNLTFDGTNFAHAGTGTFGTGTGQVSLNGDTVIASDKRLGVGAVSSTAMVNVPAAVTALTGASQYSYRTAQAAGVDATTRGVGYVADNTTSANGFICGQLIGFACLSSLTAGAGSTVTRYAGVMTRTQTLATSNFGWQHGNGTLAGTGTWCMYNNSADPNYLGTGATYIGTTAAVNTSETLSVITSTANTSTVAPGVVWGANSTGTAAAGFGVSHLVTLESSTTDNQSAYKVDVKWATATDASRKAHADFIIYDTAARTGISLEASGSAPMIGFLGATAVIRPATSGEATGFTAGAGTTATHLSTWTGNTGSTAYTTNDIVKHLKNLGLIAP